MKKLLTALAVVAGLGFVMSCSDEVSDYTIGAPENGTNYTKSGVVSGKYTKTFYEITENEPLEFKEVGKDGEPVYVTDPSYEKVTVGSGAYWYRKVTFETEFTGDGANVSWNDADKVYTEDGNASYYTSQEGDAIVYTVALGNVKFSGYKYTVKGFDSNKLYSEDWNPVNNDSQAAIAAKDVIKLMKGVSTDYSFTKVGDVYVYTTSLEGGNADVNVTTCFSEGADLEGGDKFTVTNLVLSEETYKTRLGYYDSDKVWRYMPSVVTNLKATETVTFTFTPRSN